MDTFGAPITKFKGRYRFLSNFYPVVVRWDGWTYPTVEHAYQAAKFPADLRPPFRDPKLKPGQAKRMGRGKGPSNWKDTSLDKMLILLRQKFRDSYLQFQLLATGGEQLIEGNDWHDTFYGVCNGDCRYGPHPPIGDNQLGKLLMKVREELQANG